MKKVLKYATGEEIPEGAIYCYSREEKGDSRYEPTVLVWHYFLVKGEMLNRPEEQS